MRTLKLAYALLALVAAAYGLIAWGQWVVRNDVRLLQAYDTEMSRERLQLVARACGKRGTLWTNPETGRYACMYEWSSFDVIPEDLHAVPRLVRQ